MTKVSELLERRAEGWEADAEDAGEGLYYTDKQQRVFKAIVENQDANIKEVAEKAGAHPSYVRYIVNRLPKDKATNEEWLRDKAGVEMEEVEEPEESEDSEEEKSMLDSFDSGEEMKVEEVEEGTTVEMTRYLPVTISVTLPEGVLRSVDDETEGSTSLANDDDVQIKFEA